jgi:hypothetical protein
MEEKKEEFKINFHEDVDPIFRATLTQNILQILDKNKEKEENKLPKFFDINDGEQNFHS